VAKFFLGAVIVTAIGSSALAGWACNGETPYGETPYGETPYNETCDYLPDGWTTGIIAAVFDGIDLYAPFRECYHPYHVLTDSLAFCLLLLGLCTNACKPAALRLANIPDYVCDIFRRIYRINHFIK
jgi:hypothetical protein